MTRSIITIAASTFLALAFLAACNGATDDDSNGIDDDPIGAADDNGPIEDDSVADQEVAVTDDEAVTDDPDDEAAPTGDDAAIADDEEDAITDDVDDAATADDDEAVTDDEDDAATDDEETAVSGDAVEIRLVDHEIEMDESIEAGTVRLSISNEGDNMHGIAIQQLNGPADDGDTDASDAAGGAFVAATTVRPGESKEIEVDLEPGEYIVFCPVGEHRGDYEMERELTVE